MKSKIFIYITLILIFIIGATYAWWDWQSSSNNDVSFNVGGMDITYEAGPDITSTKLIPVTSKEKGVLEETAIEKVITVTSNTNAYLNLYLTLEMLPDNLKHESFVYELYNNGNLVKSGDFSSYNQSDKIKIASQQKVTSTTTTFKLYIWIDGNQENPSTMQNQNFKFVLSADGSDRYNPADVTSDKLGIRYKLGTPNFTKVANTFEGVYETKDDYGTSYYFRGAADNNYVEFAGYYFRIIRINGDGSIRMIYDGTTIHNNGENSSDRQIGTSKFNNSLDNNAYLGYMYGNINGDTYEEVHTNTNDSTIKIALDNWYKNNIIDKGYSEKIADVIYCNNRQINTEDTTYPNGDGIGTSPTSYGRYRLISNKKPNLKCPNKNDAFTVDDKVKGNGALKYPVGLITADEVNIAGGKDGSRNTSYYLYTGSIYWTMSPSHLADNIAKEIGVSTPGFYDSFLTTGSYGVKPVISLKNNVNLVGKGTIDQPFRVE